MTIKLDWKDVHWLVEIGMALKGGEGVVQSGTFRVNFGGLKGSDRFDDFRTARAVAFALAFSKGSVASVEREVAPGRWEMETEFSGAEAAELAFASCGGVS